MAASLAGRAAGTVTEAFADSADREGAYRLLSNEAVSSEQLLAGVCQATALECTDHPTVYVSVDGSSLSLTDHQGGRDVGCGRLEGLWKGAAGGHCTGAR